MARNPNCKLCPLHESAENVCLWGEHVPPQGNPEVVFIGEAPGSKEAKTGRPFMGPSGQLLRTELQKAGFHSYYLTNVAKCRPPDNRTPTPKEAKACRGYLDEELATLKPKFIVALGALASKTVLGKAKITQAHGQLVEKNGYRGMPIYHPAYALRDPSKLPALQHDLQRLRKEIDGTQEVDDFKWEVTDTPAKFDQFLKEFEAAEEFSFDTETTGLFPHDRKGAIHCLGIGLEKRAWVIPVNRMRKARFALGLILQAMAKGKTAVAQNGKFDNHWMFYDFVSGFNLDFDTMLAHHLLDENQDHDLKYMSRMELDCPEYDLTAKEKRDGTPNPRKLWEYCARDAWNTLHLKFKYERRFQRDIRLRRLLYRLVMPAARAMEEIERQGLTVDLRKYTETETKIKAEISVVLKALNDMAGKAINWNSPAQVRELLYGRLKLKTKVTTDTGQLSTGEAALVDLKGRHPVIEQLIKYRELGKFLSTYIEGWKELMVDGRLYFSYKLHGTVTGRYSSRLHQVPRDGTIRNLVVAPPGWTFCQADLSQAELRIAAELSGDLELVSCFRPGGSDVHLRTVLYLMGAGKGGVNAQLARETLELYLMRYGLPSDGSGCEVLSQVLRYTKNRDQQGQVLQEVWQVSEEARSDGKAQTLWRLRERLQSKRYYPALLQALQRDSSSGHYRALSEMASSDYWRKIWGRIGWESKRGQKSLLEGWDKSSKTEALEEGLLRTLWFYTEFRRSSQESQQSRQPKIQLSDALQILSSLTPQSLQEIKKEWKDIRKRLGKASNFGLIYGMYENKFIETCKLKYGFEPTWDEAHELREAYFELYSSLPKWHEKQKKLVKLDGQVTNLFGRVRRLPGIYSSDKELRSECERQAINAPVQGAIGDWKAAALVEINQQFSPDCLRIVGEHHDALLMIVRNGAERETLPKVRAIMRKPKLLETFKINMRVPMDCSIELGPWGAGKTYEEDL